MNPLCPPHRPNAHRWGCVHYNGIIMSTIASQITSLTIVYSSVYSGADQRKPQSSASLAFVRGIHRGPVNSPHKWPVTRKMFPFDDVIMGLKIQPVYCSLLWYTLRRQEGVSLFKKTPFQPVWILIPPWCQSSRVSHRTMYEETIVYTARNTSTEAVQMNAQNTSYQRQLFCYHALIQIPAWRSNYIQNKVWDEITDRFPNFNGAAIEV